MTSAREELESLMSAQADEEAEESRVQLKRKAKMPAGHDRHRQRWGYIPALAHRTMAEETKAVRDQQQPWELDKSLLPKRPPGRK